MSSLNFNTVWYESVKFRRRCLGHILAGFRNLLNSKKGRLQSLRQPETKRMRILKTAEPEVKAISLAENWRQRRAFLSFDIRTTVARLEVYLQNLKSLRSL